MRLKSLIFNRLRPLLLLGVAVRLTTKLKCQKRMNPMSLHIHRPKLLTKGTLNPLKPTMTHLQYHTSPRPHFFNVWLNPPLSEKKGATMEEMFEIFRQVKINLPLLEAVKKIPSYAKFLKDLCTQKRKAKNNVFKKIFLTEQISSIIQHQTPPKFKDPGAPTIS